MQMHELESVIFGPLSRRLGHCYLSLMTLTTQWLYAVIKLMTEGCAVIARRRSKHRMAATIWLSKKTKKKEVEKIKDGNEIDRDVQITANSKKNKQIKIKAEQIIKED